MGDNVATEQDQPAANNNTQQPAANNNTQQPAANTNTQQPAANNNTQQPAANNNTQQPAANTNTQQPAANTNTQQTLAKEAKPAAVCDREFKSKQLNDVCIPLAGAFESKNLIKKNVCGLKVEGVHTLKKLSVNNVCTVIATYEKCDSNDVALLAKSSM